MATQQSRSAARLMMAPAVFLLLVWMLVPLTMTLKMALESDDRTRWVAILLGSERDAGYALRRRAGEKEAVQATSTSS